MNYPAESSGVSRIQKTEEGNERTVEGKRGKDRIQTFLYSDSLLLYSWSLIVEVEDQMHLSSGQDFWQAQVEPPRGISPE
jgi:hypothetical protein